MMLGLLLVSGTGLAAADGVKPATRISQDLADLLSPRAAALSVETDEGVIESPVTPIPDVVTIDAVASGDPAALEAELIALGAQDTAIAGRMVSARIPLAAIPYLEGVVSLQFARAAQAVTNVGIVTSQGDKVMRADIARGLYGVDGTGVLVGVLSDSYNCQGGATFDMATGDLPPTVMVVQESSCGSNSSSDEGGAMLQIVHDVAPGASLAFATAFNGQASFANNIKALRDAGAKVIVDDVSYIDAPMYQDGVIAQAVDNVKASGVAYFSSAGNQARHAYEHAFVPGQIFAPGAFAGLPFLGGTAHNFGGTAMQRISFPAGTGFTLALQWDSPFFSVSGDPGTPNDLDIYLLQNNVVVRAATTNNLMSKDPVEVLSAVCLGPGTCVRSIMIVNHAGPDPGRFKLVFYGASRRLTLTPAMNSGTIYGHANALGAIAVGAANYKTPTTLEPFSSGGTTPVLFDTLGNRLMTPDLRQFKPEIVAPDGANTTFFSAGNDPEFDGFPNFFGTSAAAPHAAGVAALMVQALPTLPPETLRNTLENTALNMGAAGFDVNTGFGLIRADAALAALHTLTITGGPSGTPDPPVVPGGVVSLSVDAVDSFGHTLTFAWTSTCTGIPSGTFNDATLRTPTWTAAANATGATQTCVLKVVVNDGHGTTKTASINETVLSVPKVTTLTPAAATVGTTITIGGMGLTGSSLVTFAGGAKAVPTAVTATSLQVVVAAGALTGILSVTNPAGSGNSAIKFKALPKITSLTPDDGVVTTTVVTIAGTTFTGASAVRFGAVAVAPGNFAVVDDSTITANVPATAVTAPVSITTPGGTATSPAPFVVIKAPTITSFTPAVGAEGTVVTLKGTNLASVTGVTINGLSAGPVTVVSPTSVRVTIPTGATTGRLAVVNPAAGPVTSATDFRVAPRIVSVSPAQATSGTIVTLAGATFGGATSVKFGAVAVAPLSFTVVSNNSITATVPATAISGRVTVTTPAGTATSPADFIVIRAPTISSFTPAAGPIGTSVTVNGTNLASVTSVSFNDTMASSVTILSATSLRAVVPASATSGKITVVDPAGQALSAGSFAVTPSIDGFQPSRGAPGTLVTITGQAFTGATAVRVGGVMAANIAVTGSTQITATVPPTALSGPLSVTTGSGTGTSASSFTVVRAPTITSVAPPRGPIGSTVTLTGGGLGTATAVDFNGTPVSGITVLSATSVRVVVPPGAQTGRIHASNEAGPATSPTDFVLTPRLLSTSPGRGLPDSMVTLTGTSFSAPATVRFGALLASFVQVDGATQITTQVPSGALTGKISVTTPTGTTTSTTNFVVIRPPRVSSFTPAAGAEGTLVTLSGANLAGVNQVAFGSANATSITVLSASSIQMVVPDGATTSKIAVSDEAGNAQSAATFTVTPRILTIPAAALPGAGVTITGTSLTSASAVRFGGVAATTFTVDGPTQITAAVPTAAVSGKITVTTPGGTATSLTDFTVIRPPTVMSFTPVSGQVGALITLNGTNLGTVTAVTFGNVSVTAPITVVSPTSIKVTAPSGALTGRIAVTNPAASAQSATNFTLVPRITGFGAPSGSDDTVVTILGTSFTGVTSVKFGTVSAAFTFVSDGEITALVPAAAITGRVSVTTPGGTATSPADLVITAAVF
jgi:hypothetical protein